MHKTSGKLATPVGVVESSPHWSTLPQGASHRPACIAVENFMYLHVPDVSHDMALTRRCYLCRLMRTTSEGLEGCDVKLAVIQNWMFLPCTAAFWVYQVF